MAESLVTELLQMESSGLAKWANVCVSARHRLVFPVPGDPWSNNRQFQLTILGDTPMLEKSKAESAYRNKLVLIPEARMRESQTPSRET
jgi:hypothetical protein